MSSRPFSSGKLTVNNPVRSDQVGGIGRVENYRGGLSLREYLYTLIWLKPVRASERATGMRVALDLPVTDLRIWGAARCDRVNFINEKD